MKKFFLVAVLLLMSTISSRQVPSHSVLALLHEVRIERLEEFNTVYNCLDLSGRGLTSLQGIELVDGIKDVERLYLNLEGNNLTFDEIARLRQLPNLIFLNVNGNRLEGAIKKDIFKGLENLKKLYMHGNTITDVEAGAFNDQAVLKELFIGDGLTRITKEMFKGLANLEILDLRFNQITSIEVNAFKDLVGLNYLVLLGNRLEKIEKGTFLGLQNLEVLRLGNNQALTFVDTDGLNFNVLKDFQVNGTGAPIGLKLIVQNATIYFK